MILLIECLVQQLHHQKPMNDIEYVRRELDMKTHCIKR